MLAKSRPHMLRALRPYAAQFRYASHLDKTKVVTRVKISSLMNNDHNSVVLSDPSSISGEPVLIKGWVSV